MSRCYKCGASISLGHMNRHLKSLKCQMTREIADVMEPVRARMDAEGWEHVKRFGWVRTLKKAGVPIKRDVTFASWNHSTTSVQTAIGSWAPKWATIIVSSKASIDHRVAVLKMCLKDEKKRDAVHSILLMAKKDDRAEAIKIKKKS